MMSKTDWAEFLADAGAHVVQHGKDAEDWLTVFDDTMREFRRGRA